MTSGGDIKIDKIELVTAGAAAAEKGLLGWIRCRLNNKLQLDGITLRRTQDGRHTLSFPSKRDGAGNQRFYIRPLDDAARREVEQQILVALGIAV